MVHAVGHHCAEATTEVCPLCECLLQPKDAEVEGADVAVFHVVLDRHLQQNHLPQLEIIGRLFHSFGETVLTKNMMSLPVNLDTLMRSYR